jgi:hypothetical protein
MKRTPFALLLAGITLAWSAPETFAQANRVSSIASRETLLQRAAKLAASLDEKPTATDAQAKDPFNPPESDLRELVPVVERPVDTGPRQLSPREVLALVADRMVVIGTAARGDETFLMLREKMLKTGDVHVVRHEGVDYAVTITHIEGNRYTLRYRNEELTRAIQ